MYKPLLDKPKSTPEAKSDVQAKKDAPRESVSLGMFFYQKLHDKKPVQKQEEHHDWNTPLLGGKK